MNAPANDNRSIQDSSSSLVGKLRCPICREFAVADYRPFCSRRCADVDLSRWLNGVYAVPVQSDPDMDEAELDAMIDQIEKIIPFE
jgi:uncharacterized protein